MKLCNIAIVLALCIPTLRAHAQTTPLNNVQIGGTANAIKSGAVVTSLAGSSVDLRLGTVQMSGSAISTGTVPIAALPIITASNTQTSLGTVTLTSTQTGGVYRLILSGSGPSGGGASTFLALTDTPSSFSGQGGKVVAVNTGATALEFITPSGGGGGGGGGLILSATSVARSDTQTITSANTWEDITGMTLTITPQSSSSKFFITGLVNVGYVYNQNSTIIRILRNGTPIFIGDAASARAQVSGFGYEGANPYGMETIPISGMDSPATASAVTYKVQFANSTGGAGTSYLNRSGNDVDAFYAPRGASSFHVFEVGVPAALSVPVPYQVQKNDTFSTTSTTWVDVTGLSLTITPKTTSSKILVSYAVQVGFNYISNHTDMRLLRNGSPIGVGDSAGGTRDSLGAARAYNYDNNVMESLTQQILDEPASASPVTYQIQIKVSGAGNSYVNRSHNDTVTSGARTHSSLTAVDY